MLNICLKLFRLGESNIRHNKNGKRKSPFLKESPMY